MFNPVNVASSKKFKDWSVSNPDGKANILIGCSGSVASIKIPQLVAALSAFAYVKVVSTENATHFLNVEEVGCDVFRDSDEWAAWSIISDPVLHIDLRKWADLLLIAPLDANTLAKMANGICDNLLTCVVRAWDLTRPLIFAPAMNTHMWNHPLTAKHIEQLTAFGYAYVPVVEKTLVCGDKGLGAMAEVDTLVQHVKDALKKIGRSGSKQ